MYERRISRLLPLDTYWSRSAWEQIATIPEGGMVILGPLFVLVHSPLVGPSTWSLVANDLRRRGYDVLVPAMANPTEAPFWSRHVDSIVNALAHLPATEQVILVGHSGAGPLLPAIARSAARRVAAYVFVDAGLPNGGESRMGTGDFSDYLHDLYARGDRFPNWSAEDLLDEVPDPALRAQLHAELRPQALAFWEEPLPVIDNWSNTPGAFLQFTSTYEVPAEQERLLGWP